LRKKEGGTTEELGEFDSLGEGSSQDSRLLWKLRPNGGTSADFVKKKKLKGNSGRAPKELRRRGGKARGMPGKGDFSFLKSGKTPLKKTFPSKKGKKKQLGSGGWTSLGTGKGESRAGEGFLSPRAFRGAVPGGKPRGTLKGKSIYRLPGGGGKKKSGDFEVAKGTAWDTARKKEKTQESRNK